MKSAYELAMERLEKASPSTKLNADQKAQIAEITSIARAKVAEKELFLREQIAKAELSGDMASVGQLEHQLSRETQRIQDDAEEKRERIRQS